jgi:RimJ/RimL family protein N-acetyltransferase
VSVPSIRSDRLELVSLSTELLTAMLATDGPPFRMPPDWPDAHDRRFLELRVRDLDVFPQYQEWLVRAVVREGEMIGHAGFHGPPGINAIGAPGALEIGYSIFPPHRRQGYGSETAESLIEWAHRERAIRHFVASVAPGNDASLGLVGKLGFEQTGSRVDDEDGLELVFERWFE